MREPDTATGEYSRTLRQLPDVSFVVWRALQATHTGLAGGWSFAVAWSLEVVCQTLQHLNPGNNGTVWDIAHATAAVGSSSTTQSNSQHAAVSVQQA